ncbi:phage tail tip lysozyme [Neorhizobium galegae]|uniref:phage tail tip lysozyme n=1 Tax=Neorhizobium galegae TaxID=399 RepID=UPI0006226380|nr:phage tail tip lysozyme [Neorhizobium galegae]CDZ50420.1 Hypothetical protein NGAL_HAMBI2427_36380 [Neorhizobium galegae bv. orientalis]
MAISKAFVWGEGGAQLTPEQIAKQREIEDALLQRGVDTSPVGSAYEGLARVANAAAGSFRRGRLGRAENENKAYDAAAFNNIVGLMNGGGAGASPSASGAAVTLPGSGIASEIKATNPSIDVADNDIYSPFIDTVKAGGLSNPYGLAAVAATGKAESGWSPKNANRSWSDPSESGQGGTAGGVMSWRAERLQNLYNYAASKGEKPGAISPQTQAEFFLKEDPRLIAKLNAAQSPDEAAGLMANAWKFAGYDRPGGEAARRRSYVNAYLPKFQGGNEVASLDPSAGMAPAAAAIERQAPASGYVDPVVSAPNYQPPAAAPQSEQADAALPALPSRDIAPAPAVASVPPVQVAQAAPPAVTAPNGSPIPPEILQVLGDPRVSQRTRGIATLLLQQQQARNQAILEQRLKQADPGYQADLRLKTIQADQLVNPKISPAEQARIDMDKEKFGYQKQSGSDKLTLEREKFNADRENNRLTPDIKEYDAYAADERAAGRTPIGRLDYQQAVKKAGATNISTGEGDSFYKELDKKNAETFSTLSQSGMEARGKLARIDRLEGLMSNAPQGAIGALKQAAGEWGIPTEGLSDIQAASALLEKMVPEQRLPGSGTMSDGDIKMFRASLPRIINQPGGNQLIFQTMRGIAQYEQQMGEIADRVANREINPAEGRRQIQALANPLAEFKIPSGPTPNEGFQDRPDLGPGVRIRKKAD